MTISVGPTAFKGATLSILGATAQTFTVPPAADWLQIINDDASAAVTAVVNGQSIKVLAGETRNLPVENVGDVSITSTVNPTQVRLLATSGEQPPALVKPSSGTITTSAIADGAVTEAKLQAASTVNVLGAERTAHGVYDFSVQGGAIADIPFGPTLPTGAIVTAAWIEVEVAPLSAGAATLAFGLNQAGALADIKAATGKATFSIGAIVQGLPVGESDVTKFVDKLTAPAQFVVSVATAALTAGKIHVHARYVVGF